MIMFAAGGSAETKNGCTNLTMQSEIFPGMAGKIGCRAAARRVNQGQRQRRRIWLM
jgi:hypothetical protein